MSANDVVELHVSIDGGSERKFVGRYAWTLFELIHADEKGCTPIEQPAPRWSHYVFVLRQKGVVIETITEKHAGAYAGTHARYVLHGTVEIRKVVRAGEKRRAA
ncbi:winged helix domain-containing protein [Microvirga puerhi]|uniref:Winged helix domain-containing protein n=1 Tax=Microvirga puerhi TaxID=2876078 RepID=A0ABS7VUE3_9HYPH|nr:hypothetical protein [Microvirga puerhi]MBZ6079181.1 hypothetical protein [Microvirga puerhi]